MSFRRGAKQVLVAVLSLTFLFSFASTTFAQAPTAAPTDPKAEAERIIAFQQRIQEQYERQVDQVDGLIFLLNTTSKFTQRTGIVGLDLEGTATTLEVASVVEQSSAAKAGLKAHDVIVSVNGKPVKVDDEVAMKAVADELWNSGAPSRVIVLVVLRPGAQAKQTISIPAGITRPDKTKEAAALAVTVSAEGTERLKKVQEVLQTLFDAVSSGAVKLDTLQSAPQFITANTAYKDFRKWLFERRAEAGALLKQQ